MNVSNDSWYLAWDLNLDTPKNKIEEKKCTQLKTMQSTDPYCNRILTVSLAVDEEIFCVKFKTFDADSIICPTTELLSQILLL